MTEQQKDQDEKWETFVLSTANHNLSDFFCKFFLLSHNPKHSNESSDLDKLIEFRNFCHPYKTIDVTSIRAGLAKHEL